MDAQFILPTLNVREQLFSTVGVLLTEQSSGLEQAKLELKIIFFAEKD